MGKNREEYLSYIDKRIFTWRIARSTRELVVMSAPYNPGRDIKKCKVVHLLQIPLGKGKYRFEPLFPKDNKKTIIRDQSEQLYEEDGKNLQSMSKIWGFKKEICFWIKE